MNKKLMVLKKKKNLSSSVGTLEYFIEVKYTAD